MRVSPRHFLVGGVLTLSALVANAVGCGSDERPATTSAGGNSAGGGGAGGSNDIIGGACSEATADADCGTSNDCRTTSCIDSVCRTKVEPKGTSCNDDGGATCDGNGACVPLHCIDGEKNEGETDVDCGGTCSACPNDAACAAGEDCTSRYCEKSGNDAVGTCKACSEADDCGEGLWCDPTAQACVTAKDDGATCATAVECTSGFCAEGVCCDSACTDACSSCSTLTGATMDGVCTASAVRDAADPGTCDDTHGTCDGGVCTCDASGACTEKVPEPTQLVAGQSHTCALFPGGAVKCWGANLSGQLGLGDMAARGDAPNEMGDALPTVDLGSGAKALAIAAGFNHTCALLEGGSVKCWGANTYGQLGVGDKTARGEDPGEMGTALPVVPLGSGKLALSIAAGGNHTCALLIDGSMKCWGRSDYGQLGLGDGNHRGDEAGEMGDALPSVDVGFAKKVTSMALGDSHTCVVLDIGAVKCWGRNQRGQLGLGLATSATKGSGPNEMGDKLPAVNLGTGKKVKLLTAGENHNCATLDDNTLKCWGANVGGQLGLGDALDRGADAAKMGNNLPAVNVGSNKTATSTRAGFEHNCALLNDGALKCWGRSNYGQLGLGDKNDRGDSANEMGDALPALSLGTKAMAIATVGGKSHSCSLLVSGTVKCWGRNDQGQLGLGDTTTRGDSPDQMGDALPAVKLYGK